MVEADDQAKGTMTSDESEESSCVVQAVQIAVASAARMVAPPFGANSKLAESLRRVDAALGRLAHLGDEAFVLALEQLAKDARATRPPERKHGQLRNFRDVPLELVERMIADTATTKNELLAIARERFDAPTGALAKLNRAALGERLSALVMNERGHTTVARLAATEPTDVLRRTRSPDQSVIGSVASHKVSQPALEASGAKGKRSATRYVFKKASELGAAEIAQVKAMESDPNNPLPVGFADTVSLYGYLYQGVIVAWAWGSASEPLGELHIIVAKEHRRKKLALRLAVRYLLERNAAVERYQFLVTNPALHDFLVGNGFAHDPKDDAYIRGRLSSREFSELQRLAASLSALAPVVDVI